MPNNKAHICFGSVAQVLLPLSISISLSYHPVCFKLEMRCKIDFKHFRCPGLTVQTWPQKSFWSRPQSNPDYSTMTTSFGAFDVTSMKLNYNVVQVEGEREIHKDDGWRSSLVKTELPAPRGLVTVATKERPKKEGKEALSSTKHLLGVIQLHHQPKSTAAAAGDTKK